MGLMVKELYQTIDATLKNAGIESHEFEAGILIEEYCGIDKMARIEHPEAEISEKQYRNTLDAAQKRSTHYPLQYILKSWEFFGREYRVGKGVLIPRPDTEILVEHALEYLKVIHKTGYRKIVDLCSGTGCIALSIEAEMQPIAKTQIFAIELDNEAYPYLVANVKAAKSRVVYKHEDAVSELCARHLKDVDIIVSNPPYLTRQDMSERQEEVTYEPFVALYGGDDGLYFYRRIIKVWKNSLRKGGMLAFEIGMGQHEDVKNLLIESGYSDIQFVKDYSGIIRVVSGIR